jgi:beta-RFAP synthase
MTGTEFRITTPSRLHFGLLAWGERHPRQFGSVGLMVNAPGIAIHSRASHSWSVAGPLADRASAVAQRVVDTLVNEGRPIVPLHLTIERTSPEHVGLGTGTQLSLSVARLILAASGESEPSIERLALLTGRGRRSGIGLHGFMLGGLLVDGGRAPLSYIPPLLSRISFPSDWSILVVIPPTSPGLAGEVERDAFSRLSAVRVKTVERLCRMILLELLPSAAERDLPAFGAALSEIQEEVGRGFSTVQGGVFGHPQLESIARSMRGLGLVGVGQSSWGPSLFGLLSHEPELETMITRTLRDRFHLDEGSITWTRASKAGSRLRTERDDGDDEL